MSKPNIAKAVSDIWTNASLDEGDLNVERLAAAMERIAEALERIADNSECEENPLTPLPEWVPMRHVNPGPPPQDDSVYITAPANLTPELGLRIRNLTAPAPQDSNGSDPDDRVDPTIPDIPF